MERPVSTIEDLEALWRSHPAYSTWPPQRIGYPFAGPLLPSSGWIRDSCLYIFAIPECVPVAGMWGTPGLRLFQVADFAADMDWYRRSPPLWAVDPYQLYCEAIRLGRELPLWRAFGPAGQPVLALLEFVTALSPEEAARLAQRAGTMTAISYKITGDVPFLPSPFRHPARDAVDDVAYRLEQLLAHKAPEAALDGYSLGHGKYRLADPGWQRLWHAAYSFAAVTIMADLFAPSVIRAVRQRWERVVQP